MTAPERTLWVSYLRVSTPEQAAKDLSLPAQREAVEHYAARCGRTIAREYVEAGCSGTEVNRRQFRQMLEDAMRPGSDIAAIVVHHTSRFARNATLARVVKQQLRKKGVKVISVCQDLNEDPMGQLIEGIFECIDQYESEVNGLRTSAALREAVRQGFFPGSKPPFGFQTAKVEVRPGLVRSMLIVNEEEAAIVRELFQLYVANAGAKTTAQALNERGRWYHRGLPWSRDLVLKVLDEPAVAGTYWWGKYDSKTRRKKDQSEWLPLKVDALVEPALHELVRRLRERRAPGRNPGRAAPRETLLKGLVRCGKCGASYTLEGSGKRFHGEVYKYRYYNCRTTCRIGKQACAGWRIPMSALDELVLGFMADRVCTTERCARLLGLRETLDARIARAQESWTTLIRAGGTVSRNYLHHLIERIEVDENRISIIPREEFRAVS